MACPFAQLSPLLLLSFLALFFQYGASFFSPKPIVASLHRGRSFTGELRICFLCILVRRLSIPWFEKRMRLSIAFFAFDNAFVFSKAGNTGVHPTGYRTLTL